jgi:type I restriction enzyme, S subunit
MNETLEAMAMAIFKDWFIDFGPTRAKAEGSPPYLAPEIWALFPDRLDDEDKPEGWKTGCLDDLLILQRGFDLPNDKRLPGPYVVLAASGPNGFHDQYMVDGPGVTTGRSGVLGKVFFINEDFWPLNTSLWVKQFKASTPVYAYFLLQNLDLASFNAGSAVPTLNRNHVHKLPLPVPSKPAVMAFDEAVMPLFRRRRMNELESDTLANTRDLLLPKLMSGEIRLRDAEKIVEAAA